MKSSLATIGLLLSVAANAQQPGPREAAARICADMAHGQAAPAAYAPVAAKLGKDIVPLTEPISAGSLERCRVLVLQSPTREFTAAERDAIAGFVRAGRSLLVAFDEERRTPLETTRVNDIVAPFGMKLTADTEYLHNTG